jgi:toxin-antitoxin system PIN domain toxin
MKYLLDVNVLLAAIWENHPQHSKAFTWLLEKDLLLCPLTELGFLRISTNKKVVNAPMAKARELLEKFSKNPRAERILDDLPALNSHPKKSAEVPDHYLADLAAKHGARLATFDHGIAHRAVAVI